MLAGGRRAKYPGGRAHHGRGWASVVIFTLLTEWVQRGELGAAACRCISAPATLGRLQELAGPASAIATAAGVLGNDGDRRPEAPF